MSDEVDFKHHTHAAEPHHTDHYVHGTPLSYGWITQMTPEQRERQLAKRVSKGEEVATWVILIGMTVLVALGFIIAAHQG